MPAGDEPDRVEHRFRWQLADPVWENLMAWLRLTDAQGKGHVFVNMDLIVLVRRFPSQDVTRLISASLDANGGAKVFVVTEAPEEIMESLQSGPTQRKVVVKNHRRGHSDGRAHY
jgi:hypothetical protein